MAEGKQYLPEEQKQHSSMHPISSPYAPHLLYLWPSCSNLLLYIYMFTLCLHSSANILTSVSSLILIVPARRKLSTYHELLPFGIRLWYCTVHGLTVRTLLLLMGTKNKWLCRELSVHICHEIWGCQIGQQALFLSCNTPGMQTGAENWQGSSARKFCKEKGKIKQDYNVFFQMCSGLWMITLYRGSPITVTSVETINGYSNWTL